MALLTASSGKVKAARRLVRRSTRLELGLFRVEGWKGLEAAAGSPAHEVVEVFAVPAAAEEHAALLAGHRIHLVDDRALAALTEAVSPQGLVAVCRIPRTQAPTGDLLVVCADVRDPGNAGTVIRCADAVGAAGVVLSGRSVDPYNAKTVRASVGSLFHLPVHVEPDTTEVLRRARSEGLTVLAADGDGELDLDDAIDEGLLAGPTAWLFGNEAWGLPADLAARADHRVRIPIHGRAESLNLSTAAAVCLYASARAQRRR
ncbi:RNA methyltransferase [Alteromonas gracilis]